ncbi:cupin domain-containing protein [Halocatena halophila]|uniref:cupin domain-containing protein n=1 Tax=Halocatena halophila TaxID=2814576 RepID=UPI002ED18381
MEHVHIEDVDEWMGPAALKQPLGRALGASDVAINYYELLPSESFAFGYHRHSDQEEIFIVLSGTVTFETDDGERVVEEGSAIRFEPGVFQQGVNEGTERVRALAIGAPQESGETEIRRDCPSCADRTPQSIEPGDDCLHTVCNVCETKTGNFT